MTRKCKNTISTIILFIIYVAILCFTSCTPKCNHEPGQHIPNDTIYCTITDKKQDSQYSPVTHTFTFKKKVKIMKPNGDSRWINNAHLFNTLEVGDTIYDIHHHCPTEYFEFKTK